MRRSLAVAALSALFASYTRAQVAGSPNTDGIKCPDNYSICSGLGEPFLMCCPSGSQCIGLAENTTKLCCRPDQNGCVDIAPISCDIRNQNATRFPESVLTTSLLEADDLELPRCHLDKSGNPGCCPFGFLCDPDNKQRCRKQKDQLNWKSVDELELTPFKNSEIPRISSQPTNSASSAATAAASDSGTTAPPSVNLPVLPQTNTDEGSKVPLSPLLAGLFGGLALVGFGAINLVCCIRNRRTKQKSAPSEDRELAKEHISRPIPGQDFVGRAEFSSQCTPSYASPYFSKREKAKNMTRNFRKSVRLTSQAAARGLGISYGNPANPPPMPSVAEKDYYETPFAPSPLFKRESWQQRSPPHSSPRTPIGNFIVTVDAASDIEESSPQINHNNDTCGSIYSNDGGRQTFLGTRNNGGGLRPLSFNGMGRPLTGPTMFTDRSPFTDDSTYEVYDDVENALEKADMPKEREQIQILRAAKEERPTTQWCKPATGPNSKNLV